MSDSVKNDLKQINMILPSNLNQIKTNIDIIINKDEEIIKKYIESVIYTSKLTDNMSKQLEKIYKDVREHIL